jgi:iron-sulfur cluster assembly protein
MLFVADSAKSQVTRIRETQDFTEDYFIRVSVTSGGCCGLSYKMDFDNELQESDQVFDDNGVRIVTDLKSFLYLCNTTLEFSGGLNGKGFVFNNPNASRSCGCGESFAVESKYYSQEKKLHLDIPKWSFFLAIK